MSKRIFLKLMVLSFVVIMACDFSFNLSTVTPPAATATASGFGWPDEPGECTLHTNSQVSVYSRPSDQSDVFGQVDSGFETVVTARTTEGWAGFDPGVAQAANIGIFRLRWIFFNDATFTGSCASIPEGWVPDPVACYTMPMEEVQVYEDSDSSSNVMATLDVEDFAVVLGLTDDGWAQVDLGLGNTGLTGIGWIDQATLNLNGSACNDLPTVSP